MTTCSTRLATRLVSTSVLLHVSCYAADPLPVPPREPYVDVEHVTLLGLGSSDAMIVSTSPSNGVSVYGLSGDSSPPAWYPADVQIVAIQFSAGLLLDDYGDMVDARDVRVGRTTACNDSCEGLVDDFRVKAGRVCNKFWDGSSTNRSPVQFYEWVDGVWARRVAQIGTPGLNVDDIRCKLSLELIPMR